MKAENWQVMNAAENCLKWLQETIEESEELYNRGVIDKKEMNARICWFWEHTANRIMNETLDKHLPI